MKGSGGEQGSETANHNEKKKNGGSGFSIKGVHCGAATATITVIITTTGAVCGVCVCVSEQECFLQCVGGVISLPYITPLKSLFKG